jgi:hypothetical protein
MDAKAILMDRSRGPRFRWASAASCSIASATKIVTGCAD